LDGRIQFRKCQRQDAGPGIDPFDPQLDTRARFDAGDGGSRPLEQGLAELDHRARLAGQDQRLNRLPGEPLEVAQQPVVLRRALRTTGVGLSLLCRGRDALHRFGPVGRGQLVQCRGDLPLGRQVLVAPQGRGHLGVGGQPQGTVGCGLQAGFGPLELSPNGVDRDGVDESPLGHLAHRGRIRRSLLPPVDRGQSAFVAKSRRDLAGEDHRLADGAPGGGARIDALEPDRTLGVDVRLDLRRAQRDRAARDAAGQAQPRRPVQAAKQLGEWPLTRGDPAIGFEVVQPGAGADDRPDQSVVDDLPRVVQLDKKAQGRPVLVLDEARRLLRDRRGQHGHRAIGVVVAERPAESRAIERIAGRDEGRRIRDVDAESLLARGALVQGQHVVDLAGPRPVDADRGEVRQIHTPVAVETPFGQLGGALQQLRGKVEAHAVAGPLQILVVGRETAQLAQQSERPLVGAVEAQPRRLKRCHGRSAAGLRGGVFLDRQPFQRLQILALGFGAQRFDGLTTRGISQLFEDGVGLTCPLFDAFTLSFELGHGIGRSRLPDLAATDEMQSIVEHGDDHRRPGLAVRRGQGQLAQLDHGRRRVRLGDDFPDRLDLHRRGPLAHPIPDGGCKSGGFASSLGGRRRYLAARLDDLDDAGRRDALIPTCFGDRANALLLLAEHDAECQRIAAPHGDDRTRRRS
jgi:hypothetical protein